jgi:serine/threonine-protein kinase RsbW
VTDDGKPFDLTKVSENTEIEKPLEERKIGGLGIHFIRTLAGEIIYKSEDGVNKLSFSLLAGNQSDN